MNVVLVCNEKSGGGFSPDELTDMFRRHGIVVQQTVLLGDGFEKKLAPFIKRGATIAAVGGDGTISAVANLVAGTKAVLAPLPGGTLNHFVKDLGVPQDLDDALAALAAAKPRAIDVAKVNGRVFINNSSIGFYPSSLRERDRLEDKLGKWPAAIMASIHTMTRLKGYEVRLEGETLSTPFVFVGNNKYEIREPGLPERKRLDAGVLTVFVARRASRWSLAKIALLSLVGRAHLLEEFDVRMVKTVRIASRRKSIGVSRDGELSRMRLPLRYEVVPGALRVLG